VRPRQWKDQRPRPHRKHPNEGGKKTRKKVVSEKASQVQPTAYLPGTCLGKGGRGEGQFFPILFMAVGAGASFGGGKE